MCHGLCNLWSPAFARLDLVPTGEGVPAEDPAFRRGAPFRSVRGPVAGDFVDGLRRTQERVGRLLEASSPYPIPRGAVATVTSNVGRTVITWPFAA